MQRGSSGWATWMGLAPSVSPNRAPTGRPQRPRQREDRRHRGLALRGFEARQVGFGQSGQLGGLLQGEAPLLAVARRLFPIIVTVTSGAGMATPYAGDASETTCVVNGSRGWKHWGTEPETERGGAPVRPVAGRRGECAGDGRELPGRTRPTQAGSITRSARPAGRPSSAARAAKRPRTSSRKGPVVDRRLGLLEKDVRRVARRRRAARRRTPTRRRGHRRGVDRAGIWSPHATSPTAERLLGVGRARRPERTGAGRPDEGVPVPVQDG